MSTVWNGVVCKRWTLSECCMTNWWGRQRLGKWNEETMRHPSLCDSQLWCQIPDQCLQCATLLLLEKYRDHDSNVADGTRQFPQTPSLCPCRVLPGQSQWPSSQQWGSWVEGMPTIQSQKQNHLKFCSAPPCRMRRPTMMWAWHSLASHLYELYHLKRTGSDRSQSSIVPPLNIAIQNSGTLALVTVVENNQKLMDDPSTSQCPTLTDGYKNDGFPGAQHLYQSLPPSVLAAIAPAPAMSINHSLNGRLHFSKSASRRSMQSPPCTYLGAMENGSSRWYVCLCVRECANMSNASRRQING